ncbi:MAG TPA: prepilin-type N-terminal cleavage/methylation domain-containing protein [Syntrophaceticus sp.]|jgi:prepilin-type N-terminal cleavage/methylation domain-containing protein|uniref:BIG2 domain-containing protein n=1 Tax=Syntrophaceticus schinkii TaxID=499207 RepID=A0A0B7MC77_9FIRM|nr:Ig-like domain-containing protein [Syntrophaceticus schinkii]MDD4261972.1 Ig-like domain-containing protein [Syntrophaceticus schinkii]CEO87665.1 hypothetical protein SSCH_1170022 [Syntrophaceticus schinkii]HHY29751.1 prepilin-type N-terminal cleavage/methylation domain-containing protein [Syntrophaceticus sp.]
MLKCKKGFTLVEVLISIVILAIISVALLLLFNQSFEGIINSGRKSKTIYEEGQKEIERKISKDVTSGTDSLKLIFKDADGVDPDKEIAIKGEIIPEDNLIAFKPNCKKEPTGEPPIVRVTGVDLDFKSLNLVKETTGNLTATVLPENATNKEVTWTSSDIGKATVSIGGVVTALSKGKCKITVTTVDAGKTATCEVHVK